LYKLPLVGDFLGGITDGAGNDNIIAMEAESIGHSNYHIA
jgi:hypothetical protein